MLPSAVNSMRKSVLYCKKRKGKKFILTLSAPHKTIVLLDQNIAILSWGSAYKVK